MSTMQSWLVSSNMIALRQGRWLPCTHRDWFFVHGIRGSACPAPGKVTPEDYEARLGLIIRKGDAQLTD